MAFPTYLINDRMVSVWFDYPNSNIEFHIYFNYYLLWELSATKLTVQIGWMNVFKAKITIFVKMSRSTLV